ncbi:MAG: class I SAM-dependent methyltransferase [Candidatus Aminicenantaceae bacterium]
MTKYRKYSLAVILLLGLALVPCVTSTAQEQSGVLEPENSNEARLNRLQPPDQVMDAIGVRAGMVVAEIGAGHGRYVVQLAVRVGDRGKVYAEDINAAFLKHLEKRCERWGLKHVESILGDVTDPKLPEGKLDVIFIISSYHHFDDPVALLRNARPALKPDGVLAIGEWLPRDENEGGYQTPDELVASMKEAGFKLDRIETFLQKNNMNLYIFRISDTYR